MKARRCPSSAHWVNSSSNWSTTSSDRRGGAGWQPPAAGPSPFPTGPGGRASAAWRAVNANQVGAVSRTRRTAAASVPASTATRSASSSNGARVGVNARQGHDAAPGAAASPSARTRGSTPARSSDDFPAPDASDTTSRPTPPSCRDIRSSTWAVAASRPKNNAASCSPNAASPRYGEPVTAVRASSAGRRSRAVAANSARTVPARPEPTPKAYAGPAITAGAGGGYVAEVWAARVVMPGGARDSEASRGPQTWRRDENNRAEAGRRALPGALLVAAGFGLDIWVTDTFGGNANRVTLYAASR